MGLEDLFSDYGSGSSSSSSSIWTSRDKWSSPQYNKESELKQKSASYLDLVMSRCTLEDVMQEFRMNGSDSPYNPDEDKTWAPPATNKIQEQLSGLGPASAFLRQQSWPPSSPGASAGAARPRPLSDWIPRTDFATSTPILNESPVPFPEAPVELTAEQSRVLQSLPNDVVYSLLRAFRAEKKRKNLQECRFCKNNGERESYYRSHSLRVGARVACPVLRALRCARCGAHGDRAHTAKYCPLATDSERQKSMAIMRSMRLASGRRRSVAADFVSFGGPSPSAELDARDVTRHDNDTLHPLWAALEQKLML